MALRATPLLLLTTALLAPGCAEEPEVLEEYVPVKGPEMSHTPPTGERVAGESVTLELTAIDDDGVAEVTVYHRTAGSTYWDSTALAPADGDLWSAGVGPLFSPGLEYYFEAADAGAATAYTSLPAQGPLDPYAIDVGARAIQPPWSEDFEVADGETSLFTMNWFTPSEAFDSYTWQHTAAETHDGEGAAFHSRVPADVGDVRDWLISPALDFSAVDEAMVTWYEYGRGTPAMGTHSLMISTGSRSIEDGDFVPLVEALGAPPEAAWGRSAAIDLSAYAGAAEVYLAWVYDGQSDDWYIDDIVVGELKVDVDASIVWAPDPMAPGEPATFTVTFDNSTLAATSGLEATLSLPSGGGTVVEPVTRPVPDLGPEGSTSVDFEVDLDPDLHDNRYLPVHVVLTDSSDTWEFDLQVTVGLPSEAALSVELPASGSLNVVFGVGDPAAPTAAVTAFSGTAPAGAQVLTADITDLYDLLPPAPGPQRWFAEVTGGSGGSVTDFTVTYDGVPHAATTLPTLGSITTIWLPEPPDPQVISSSPSTARPGDANLPLAINLRNDGAVTAGPVTGDLVSLSPEVTVAGGAGLVVTGSAWEAGTSTVISGPTVTIGDGHDRSQPARLALSMTDGVESWTEDLSIAVPWPVLNIVSTTIDDSGGDGVLDPGESASVSFEIANTGDLSTFGRVDATLSVASTSTATATLDDATGTFFSISAGTTRDEEFDLTVTSGADGDTLDLEVLLDDGTATYLATVTLVLGVPPWQAITPFDDDLDDALDSYNFDIQNAYWRIDGTQLDMLLVSSVPYDSSNVFIEAWGISSGARWTFYRWVVQPGSAGMYGYSGGDFEPIGDVTATYVSSTELMMSWNTDDMDLVLDRFDIGLAAGWCGPPEFFCDHFPNGWGWPYDGTTFDPGDWYSVSW